jgi:hypothetical protein
MTTRDRILYEASILLARRQAAGLYRVPPMIRTPRVIA